MESTLWPLNGGTMSDRFHELPVPSMALLVYSQRVFQASRKPNCMTSLELTLMKLRPWNGP
jgi:hypothetical protein